MSNFKVCRPYMFFTKFVTCCKNPRIQSSQNNFVWRKARNDIGEKMGCYIFTNSCNKPIYVGKTYNCFC